MVRQENLSATPPEQALSLVEVDKQAFDLIGKFMFVLRGTPTYLEALADMYEKETANIGDLQLQRYVHFSIGNRRYSVRYQFLDNRYSDMQSLDLIESTYSDEDPGQIADKNSLLLMSRKLEEQKGFPSARVLHTGFDHRINVNNPLAVEKAKEMLKRLSSRK